MGLREQFNKKPGLASGTVGVVIILIIGFLLWQVRGGRAPTKVSIQQFYTADDGHTWFADDDNKVPPFDYNGVPAVRCIVFKCSSSGPFAGYLQKFTPAMHDQMTGLVKPDANHIGLSPSGEILVKRPGDKNWVQSFTPAGIKVMDVRCPGGSSEKPQPVFP